MKKLLKATGIQKPTRHTRVGMSCRACADSKIRCYRRDPTTTGPCEKCVERRIHCEWPQGGSKRACQRCKKLKARCEPADSAVYPGACTACIVSDEVCSRATSQRGASSAAGGVQGLGVAGPSHAGPSQVGYTHTGTPQNGNAQPVLHVNTNVSQTSPATPPSCTSSPRSYWETVLPAEDLQ